jgi:hypothetical protein
MSETIILLKGCAGLPNGIKGDPDYSPIAAVSEKLVGKRIASVEATNYNTIKFVLGDGLSVILTPSGMEGDDLDISVVEQENTDAI